MPKKFNDVLALILAVGIPAIVMLNKWLPLPDIAIGAFLTGWALVVQFYFRKSEPKPPTA